MYIFYKILQTPNAIMAMGVFLYALMLAFWYGAFEKNNKKWLYKILCLVPMIVVMIHFAFNRFHGQGSLNNFGTMFQLYGYLYIEALLPLINLFFKKNKLPRKIISGLVSVCCFVMMISALINMTSFSKIHNYTSLTWSESFEKTVSVMKEEYVLTSWKSIDFDALLAEYLPEIQEAEKANDEAKYGAILTEFSYKCYDGHVYIGFSDEIRETVKEYLAGNDYGFSMIQLDSGKTVAVNVDEESEAYKAGIRNGSEITNWDGTYIETAVNQVECIYPFMSFPIKENEDAFRAMFLAGKGDENISCSFVDTDGNEQNITLKSQGNYRERLEKTMDLFLSEALPDDNFETRMIDDQCGYIRITQESYSTLLDAVAVARNGYYPKLTEYYNDLLENLSDQGMQYLVVDLRNNVGGYNCVAGAFVSLFTDEKMYSCGFGYEDETGYHVTEKESISPDGRWKDLPVVVLVNQNCMSAGDGFAYIMSELDNVTIMGMTTSNGVNQNNGGYCFLSDSLAFLAYPDYLTLSEEGLPLIDTDESRISSISLDVKIPIDESAIDKIFNADEDYELQYATRYLRFLKQSFMNT